MLTALRQQVQAVLYAVPAKRKPALRRSDAPDALFATDLPLVAEEEAVSGFVEEMVAQGWTVRALNGWLTLDAAVPVPEYALPAAMMGACGCCILLLLRHREDGPAQDAIRAVAKAADAGRLPFERLCEQLHGEFAVRLRLHQPLPGALLPYLCHAYMTFKP